MSQRSADTVRVAAVERKSLDNLALALSDGFLVFQLQRLAELPLAAVVVESRYSALFKLDHVSGALLADQLARPQLRYPGIPIVITTPLTDAAELTLTPVSRSTTRR